ncbi:MAG: hypothetical protein UU21_C0003G0026 [Candidatus Levybacteria bacterium GW2011_GWA2_40_8]|nr:MAG: hypothetical protein UU21_C0003G0026 [Candidatus Levybacteria bacterium GW2011_GWA2_40_8]
MIERRSKYQYNTFYDSLRFRALMAHKGSAGFDQRLARETRYIHRQLKTDLGERLDVSKSDYIFEIRGDRLYGEGDDEPFEEVIRRGNRRRRIDWQREDMEVESFMAIQKIMTDPSTPEGTAIIEITPPGSRGTNYEKNYFRVFVKSEGKVLGTSHFSDLTNSEYRDKIVSLNPLYSDILPESPTDVELKSVPVVIPSQAGFVNADWIANFILDRQVGISPEELEQVWIDVAPGAVTSYINTLIDNPTSLYAINMAYEKHLEAAGKSRKKQVGMQNLACGVEVTVYTSTETSSSNWAGSAPQIHYHENGQKQIGGGGCGGGSCSTTESTPVNATITVSGPDGLGPINVPCPSCGAINKRPFKGYVEKCKSCNSEEILPKILREKLKSHSASAQAQ